MRKRERERERQADREMGDWQAGKQGVPIDSSNYPKLTERCRLSPGLGPHTAGPQRREPQKGVALYPNPKNLLRLFLTSESYFYFPRLFFNPSENTMGAGMITQLIPQQVLMCNRVRVIGY